jgi:hypothetical protein
MHFLSRCILLFLVSRKLRLLHPLRWCELRSRILLVSLVFKVLRIRNTFTVRALHLFLVAAVRVLLVVTVSFRTGIFGVAILA